MQAMNKEQKEDLQKSIGETEQAMRELPAGQQAAMDEVVKILKQQLKAIDDLSNATFSREIIDEGGKKIFRNPDYERKPPNWKLCYRAGRETIEAAWGCTKQWLEELNKTK